MVIYWQDQQCEEKQQLNSYVEKLHVNLSNWESGVLVAPCVAHKCRSSDLMLLLLSAGWVGPEVSWVSLQKI